MTAALSATAFDLPRAHPVAPAPRAPRPLPAAAPRDSAGPARSEEDPCDDAGPALAALVLAVPAAVLTTGLWFLLIGGGVWHLAGVYALSGNLTFWLALAGLARARRAR